jgi:hypothetical protein
MQRRFFYSIPVLLAIAVSAAGSIRSQNNTDAVDQDAALRALTDQLKEHAWVGIRLTGISPSSWAVHVTRPMKEILSYGSAAQGVLLQRISDPQITDQVIFLLGGVGDERAIGPIINAMIDARDIDSISNATKINFSADFALTNITAAEVVWPHSGGNLILQCPQRDSKRCWQEWWSKHRTRFTAAAVPLEERYQPFYPDYGIYRVSDNTRFYDDEDLRKAIGPKENK